MHSFYIWKENNFVITSGVTYYRPATTQRVLQQDTQPPVAVRTSRRPRRLTIGEETGQKEQPISDGSDFVSGYSDDSDHLSQGDDSTGLVAEV